MDCKDCWSLMLIMNENNSCFSHFRDLKIMCPLMHRTGNEMTQFAYLPFHALSSNREELIRWQRLPANFRSTFHYWLNTYLHITPTTSFTGHTHVTIRHFNPTRVATLRDAQLPSTDFQSSTPSLCCRFCPVAE